MYFGNNKGLLSYDGSHWNLFQMPNHSVVRSIAIGEKDRIYTGGYNSLGYLYTNNDGQRAYHDLIALIPEKHRDFGEIWRIHVTNYGVIFQSYTTILLYHQDEIKVLAENQDFQFSFYIDDAFYISHRSEGLMRYTGQSFIPVTRGDFFINDKKIWTMLPYREKSYLIGTQDEGLYIYEEGRITPWESDANEFMKKNQLFSATMLPEMHMAFGSIQDGLIICDNKGNIIQHINKDSGLANNTVLSLQIDLWGNLWCGLDNGINYIEIHSPLTYLGEGSNIEGTGYSSAILDNKIYLATNQGVYVDEWNKPDNNIQTGKNFRLINELKGQTWMLTAIDDRIFVGHNKGTYIIEDGEVRLIADVEGGWKYLRVPGRENLIIAGTYSGLIRLVKKEGRWQYDGKVKGFSESCRDIYFDIHGDIWMGHGYLGVFRLHLNNTYDTVLQITEMNQKHGMNTPTEFYLFTIQGEVFHSNYDSIFRYNYLANMFEYSEEWTKKFGSSGINRMKMDKYRNIWHFGRYQNDVGVILNKNSPWIEKEFEVLNKLNDKFINAFEHVHVIDPENIILGIEDGFAHLNPSFIEKEKKDFNTIITCVEAYSIRDTLLNFCHGSRQKDMSNNVHPSPVNAVKINYSAAFFEGRENMKYLITLDGPQGHISSGWINSTAKEFTNLSYGDYTLSLRARNVYGKESKPITYSFTITTPWYQTVYAYIGYIILALAAIITSYRFIEIHFEKEHKKMEEKKKEEILAKEEQRKQESMAFENKIIQLKNEKLKAEVARKVTDEQLKNKELASFAVQINHKNEILNQMKKELDSVSKRVNEQAQTQIHGLTKKIDEDLKLDKDWEQFKIHFDQVQQGFIRKMQDSHPKLKPYDLKLCAFLRMNLSTKEIAPLMNISIRGVEIHRYRLRKKLGLERKINLVEYLMQK